MIEIYYDAGRIETATEEVRKMMNVCDQELAYFLAIDPDLADTYYATEMQQNIAILQRMSEVTRNNGQDELSAELEEILQIHMTGLQLPVR